jgi:NitT/TauT family transport system substrate-binding protein
MNNRAVLLLGLLLAIGPTIAPRPGEAQAGPGRGETVRIQDYPGTGNVLTRVAISKGYCEKRRITCVLRMLPSAPAGVQALLAGDLDMAYAPPEVAVQAVVRGADLKTFGNGAALHPLFLVVGKHVDTPNAGKGYPALMRDLRGKRVGVTARGSGSEFQLVELLAGAGMTAGDVTIVAAGAPNTSFPALATKQIDALMAFEPVGGYCEVLKTCRIVLDLRKGEGPPQLQKVRGAAVPFWVRGEYARRNPHVIEALRGAHQEAEAFVQDPRQFDELLRLTQAYFRIDHPQGDAIFTIALRESIPGFRFQLDPQALQEGVQYLVRSGQLEQPVDMSRLILGR